MAGRRDEADRQTRTDPGSVAATQAAAAAAHRATVAHRTAVANRTSIAGNARDYPGPKPTVEGYKPVVYPGPKPIAEGYDPGIQRSDKAFVEDVTRGAIHGNILEKQWRDTYMPSYLRQAVERDKVLGGNARTQAAPELRFPIKTSSLGIAAAYGSTYLTGVEAAKLQAAIDAHETAWKVLNIPYERQQREALMQMSEVQRAGVLDAIGGILSTANEAGTDSISNTVNDTGSGVMNVLGSVVQGAFWPLFWANEQSMHALRANAYMQTAGVDRGFFDFRVSPFLDAWDATSAGNYDSRTMTNLTRQYGELRPRIAREWFDAQNSENAPEALGRLIAKYEGNTEAETFLGKVMSAAELDDETRDIMDRVDGAQSSQIGAVFASTTGLNPGSAAWNLLRDTTNVTAPLVADPTLFAAKARATYMAGKYAIANLGKGTGAATVDALFKVGKVQRFWTKFAKDAEKLRAVRFDTAAQAEQMKRMRNLYGGYLRDSDIEHLAFDVKVANVDDVRSWMHNTEAVESLTRGQAARKVPLMPRMSQVQAARVEAVWRSKKAIDLDRSSRRIREAMYAPPDPTDPAVVARVDADIAAGMIDESQRSTMLLRYAKEASMRSTYVEREKAVVLGEAEGIRPSRDAKTTPLRKKALGNNYVYSDRTWRAKTDRFLRYFARQPQSRNGIVIVKPAAGEANYAQRLAEFDASARLVRSMARTALPAGHADLIETMFRNGTVGERRNLVAGLAQTIAYARGIHLNTDETAKVLMQNIADPVSFRSQYAANQTRALTGLDEDELWRLGDDSARLARDLLPDLEGETARRLAGSGRTLAGLLTERKALLARKRLLEEPGGMLEEPAAAADTAIVGAADDAAAAVKPTLAVEPAVEIDSQAHLDAVNRWLATVVDEDYELSQSLSWAGFRVGGSRETMEQYIARTGSVPNSTLRPAVVWFIRERIKNSGEEPVRRWLGETAWRAYQRGLKPTRRVTRAKSDAPAEVRWVGNRKVVRKPKGEVTGERIIPAAIDRAPTGLRMERLEGTARAFNTDIESLAREVLENGNGVTRVPINADDYARPIEAASQDAGSAIVSRLTSGEQQRLRELVLMIDESDGPGRSVFGGFNGPNVNYIYDDLLDSESFAAAVTKLKQHAANAMGVWDYPQIAERLVDDALNSVPVIDEPVAAAVGAAPGGGAGVDALFNMARSEQERARLLQEALGVNSRAILDETELMDSIKTELNLTNARLGVAMKERVGLRSAEEYAYYNPAEFNGRQHALHWWQTTDRVSVPDMREIERLSARTGVVSRLLGLSHGDFVNATVNLWSIVTLAGPRYALRNSFEDLLYYAGAGGSMLDLYRGRRAATAIREAQGGKLGIVNESMRKIGDKLSSTPFANFIVPHLDPKEISAAKAAAIDGNFEPMQALVLKSIARQKLNGMTAKQERWFADLANGPEGFHLKDEAAEVARTMDRGSVGFDDPMQDSLPGSTAMRVRIDPNSPYRDYYFGKRGASKYDTPHYALWYRQLSGILHQDGRIGQIAVANIFNKDKAVARLVDAIDSNPAFRERFTMLSEPGMTTREFASRYFDDVKLYFTDAKGDVNRDLWLRTRGTAVAEDGTEVPRFRLWEGEGETRQFRVGVKDLMDFTADQSPRVLLGREARYIPLWSDYGMQDKAWAIMGRQMARISREPIFLARYFEERKLLEGFQQRLAAQVGDEAAVKHVNSIASNRAYDLTMSYTDNPGNRSIAAWNARNVARFYRATEDFYRRTLRLAKLHPEAIWKAALTYDTIDHAGFIHTNDQGDQYFMYPGITPIFNAVTKGLSAVGLDTFVPQAPLTLGGKINMLTPSLNPDAWLPTFSGPLLGLPIAGMTAVFPSLEWVQQASMGTMSVGQPAYSQFLPAPVVRAMALMNRDERTSQWASAMKNAVQMLQANGMAPPPEADAIALAKWREQVDNTTLMVLGTRFLLGFMVPASPQTMQAGNESEYLKRMDAPTFRIAFQRLVQETGDFNKALAQWVRINPDLAPYTVSQTETPSTANVRATDNAMRWLRDNAYIVDKMGMGAQYLIPNDGDFSFATLRLMRNKGILVPKTVDAFITQTRTAYDLQKYYATKDDYEEAVAGMDDPGQKAVAKQQWDGIKAQMFAANPLLAERVSDRPPTTTQAELNDLRGAITMLRERSPDWYDDGIKRIESMIATFDDGSTYLRSVAGNTKAANEERKLVRAQMRQRLKDIAGDDSRAMAVYSNLLRKLIGGKDTTGGDS